MLSSLVSSAPNRLIISLLLVRLPGSDHMQNKSRSPCEGSGGFLRDLLCLSYLMFDIAQDE